MSILSTLKPKAGSKKSMKRLGRGDGSGHGGTSTKGHKGQLARSSPHVTRGFEGGQMPLHRRSPKWGFTNISKITYSVINLDDINTKFAAGEKVEPQVLMERGLVRRPTLPVKLLGRGKLDKKVTLEIHAASESAKAAVEKAGGSISLLKR